MESGRRISWLFALMSRNAGPEFASLSLLFQYESTIVGDLTAWYSMDNTHVNWNALDALVLDYAEAEQLLLNTDANLTSNIEVRRIIDHIRRLIEEGSVTEALDLIRQHAPSVLEDQRLIFRLHKQKFIELLRSGTADARVQAIQCSRTVLGPCALNAYPEAYEEFKRLLLALIYNKDDESSPVAEEWSEARRSELAATVVSVLKAQLHAYDPLFSLALRYLISTHNSYCFRHGVASSIAYIADMVVCKERDPPATPHDCLLEAPKFSEGDVQALAYAVDLSRQGAVDSLRYTGGDLITAFKNELSRMQLDTGIVDELVREYCVYRGLVDCITNLNTCKGSPSSINVPGLSNELGILSRDGIKETSKDATDVPMDALTEAATINMLELTGAAVECPRKGSVAETRKLYCDNNSEACVNEATKGQAGVKSSSECTQSGSSLQDVTMEEHPVTCLEDRLGDAGEVTGLANSAANDSLCSTSGASSSSGSLFMEQRNKVIRQKERSIVLRKRWKGRPGLSQTGKLQKLSAVHLENGHVTSTLSGQSRENHEVKILIEEEKQLDIEKYGIALEIRELACEGMTDEVIEEVKRLNPQFFEHNPHLLFQLKQAEFLKLVETGNYTEALGVARADMGPLAAKYQDLLKPLKETVLALARPQGEPPMKPTSPSMLAAALQVALGASLGITEPSLMKIMRATLHIHTEWFKLQMCSDSFAEILGINALKETESTSLGSSFQDTKLEANIAVSSHVTGSTTSTRPSDGSSSQQLDGSLFDDGSILTVMEWMALPRGDAIQLLAQYDGSVENLFAHLLS